MKNLQPEGFLQTLTEDNLKIDILPKKSISQDEQFKIDYHILIAYQSLKKSGKDTAALKAVVEEIKERSPVASEAAFWIEPYEMEDFDYCFRDIKEYLIRLTLDIAKDKIDALLDC